MQFNTDCTHKGVAYKDVIYSYHAVSHLFKTKLDKKDCADKYFISDSL